MTLEDFTTALQQSLEQAKLVPGSAAKLIPENFKPTTKLDVVFDGKNVNFGNIFRVHEVRLAPSIQFQAEQNAPSGANYMLLLVDPDAPTPEEPKFAFWRHWVLPGLQPLSGDTGVVGQTQPALTEYLAPGPKDESGPHRYLFLLFRQPETLDLSKDDVGGEEFVQRRSFQVDEFIEKNKLNLVSLNWMQGVGDGWKEN